MSDVTTLKICGLEYRVVYATVDQVPQLDGKEGFASLATNTIYILRGLPLCRMRDTLVHEVLHVFLASSGLGSLLSDKVRGDYEKFEETLIRLLVPSLLRLIDENGRALATVPRQMKGTAAIARVRPKKVAKR
jgi:hypothetical protein